MPLGEPLRLQFKIRALGVRRFRRDVVQPLRPIVGPKIGREHSRDQPVLFGLEGTDFAFLLDHYFDGHGLHASGRQTARDFLPEQRTDLVADDAVENAAGLLSHDLVRIDPPRLGKCLLNRRFGDGVEDHPIDPVLRYLQNVRQMPGNGLPFAIQVGCQIHGVAAFGGRLQRGNDFLLAGHDVVRRLEAILDIDIQSLRRQIAHMAHRSVNLEIRPQIMIDRFGLRGRLYDDQRFLSLGLCHVLYVLYLIKRSFRNTDSRYIIGPADTYIPPLTALITYLRINMFTPKANTPVPLSAISPSEFNL